MIRRKLYIIIAIVFLAAVLVIAYFAVYPIYHSYYNEQQEWRAEIDGIIYKLYPETEWYLDLEKGKKIGLLDGLCTSLFEVEGDSNRDVIYVTEFLADVQHVPLIRQDINLSSSSAQNVEKIELIKPNPDNSEDSNVNILGEISDKEVIREFFDALANNTELIDKNEVSISEIDEECYIIRCYNSKLDFVISDYQLVYWNDLYLCFNRELNAYSVIPFEILTKLFK